MLPSHIDNTEPYRFVIDRRNTPCVVFATKAMLDTPGMVVPLWHREAGDERSLDALVHWVAVRRERWLEWGRLAEALGTTAFYEHMRERMAAEPPALRTGTIVQREDDPAEVLLGEMMHGPHGIFVEPLYVHRFPSAEARERFYGWFLTDGNHTCVEDLGKVAFNEGTAALGGILDTIAESWAKPLSRAERRRRAKTAVKAA